MNSKKSSIQSGIQTPGNARRTSQWISDRMQRRRHAPASMVRPRPLAGSPPTQLHSERSPTIVLFGSGNDNSLGMPGAGSQLPSLRIPSSESCRLTAAKSVFGATSKDSPRQRACCPCSSATASSPISVARNAWPLVALDQRQPVHLRVIGNSLFQVWRLECRISDPSYLDHALLNMA